MVKNLLRLLLLGLLVVSAFSTTAQDDRLDVVASHSILGDVVSVVAGDAANVTSTMPVGADPHTYEPVPSDLVELAEADVVFINGGFFEEGLLEVIENADADMNLITVSSCVEMIGFGEHSHDDHSDDDHSDDDHSDDDHSDDDHSDDDHSDDDHSDDDHSDDDHSDDDHSDDDHSDDDHSDDDHSDDDHSDDDHSDDDHSDDDHSDDDHSDDDHMVDSDMEALCAAHIAEFNALHEASEMDDDHSDDDHAEGDDHDHDHAGEAESLGLYYASECAEAEGHGHDHGDDHSDDDHSEDDHSDDDHSDDHGEEGDDHDHDHGACDPHVWMEPHNVMYWTMLIRDTLIELDPANADIYTANAGAYLLELDALMHDFIMPLVDTVPEENRVLITSHDSLGYFADTFGFEVVTTVIPGFSTTADPSASDIADIIELVQEEGVPALFGETTVDDTIIQLIADEADAGFFVLYSGTLSDADGPASTYLDYMRYNTTTIVEALGGSTE